MPGLSFPLPTAALLKTVAMALNSRRTPGAAVAVGCIARTPLKHTRCGSLQPPVYLQGGGAAMLGRCCRHLEDRDEITQADAGGGSASPGR